MEKEKINILQIAPRYCFPEDDGGKIGIANITKELHRLGAQITYFTFDNGDITDDKKKLIAPYAELKTFNHSTANTIPRIAHSLFQKDSLYMTKHFTQDAFDALEKIFNKGNYDVIHTDHSAMAPLALKLKEKYGIPVGLRLHNIEWTIWQRYADILPRFSLQKIYIQSQAKKLRRNEREILKHTDIAFAITEEDRQRALELNPQANIIIASAGVDSEQWKPDDKTERNKFELILATTYKWRHNVDAVKWFIEEVLQILNKKIPQIKLTLLGKGIPKEFDAYKSIGLNPIGYVPSVQPYLNRAGIYISPLFVGGGIRIKILEAMAMQLPVIASPVAAEGIKTKDENGLFVRNSAKDFIDTILELIENDDLRIQSGINARHYVENNFSWRKNVQIMFDKYLELKKKIED